MAQAALMGGVLKWAALLAGEILQESLMDEEEFRCPLVGMVSPLCSWTEVAFFLKEWAPPWDWWWWWR